MATSKSSGTQSATVTTEHTLLDTSDAGTYVLYVDTNAMVAGDELELRVYLKVTSGGTTREMVIGNYAHAQAQAVKASIPVASVNNCKFTLTQSAGTSRSFPWEVVSL